MAKRHFANSQPCSTGPDNSFQSWFREGRYESPLPSLFRKLDSLAPKLSVVSTPPSFLVKMWETQLSPVSCRQKVWLYEYHEDYSWKVASLSPHPSGEKGKSGCGWEFHFRGMRPVGEAQPLSHSVAPFTHFSMQGSWAVAVSKAN